MPSSMYETCSAAWRSTPRLSASHPFLACPSFLEPRSFGHQGRATTTTLALFGIGPAAGASGAGRGTVGLYHLAWEVDTLADLAETADRLARLGALKGSSDHSTTKALYAEDPDGLEFEVSWLVPAEFIDDAMLAARAHIAPLDIDREIARFGSETPGGIGVSRPAMV